MVSRERGRGLGVHTRHDAQPSLPDALGEHLAHVVWYERRIGRKLCDLLGNWHHHRQLGLQDSFRTLRLTPWRKPRNVASDFKQRLPITTLPSSVDYETQYHQQQARVENRPKRHDG